MSPVCLFCLTNSLKLKENRFTMVQDNNEKRLTPGKFNIFQGDTVSMIIQISNQLRIAAHFALPFIHNHTDLNTVTLNTLRCF